MDKYKYCQDFCPLYQAIENFNRGSKGKPFSCIQAKIDCGYIEKIVKQRRGESEEANEKENH